MNNIYQYIVGNIFYFLSKIDMLPTFLLEQIQERFILCNCAIEAKCCGCKIPQVFYAPKACKLGKYTKLVSRSKWNGIKDNAKKEYEYADYLELNHSALDIKINRKLFSGVIFEVNQNIPDEIKNSISILEPFIIILKRTRVKKKLPKVYGKLENIRI